MKKAKKLVALVLAMVMAFSIMATTAAACGVEEHEHTGACSAEAIQPRKPAARCSGCGQAMSEGTTSTDGGGRYTIYTCQTAECDYRGDPIKIYW